MLKKKNIAIIIIIFILFIAFQFFRNLTGTSCIVKGITGIPCPGCGLTRSFKALMNGDVSESFRYHPLAIPVIVLLIMTITSKWQMKIRMIISNRYLQMILLVLIITTYLYRVYKYFPLVEPLTINDKSIFIRIINLCK